MAPRGGRGRGRKIQLFEEEGGVPVLPWNLEMVP
jgi:hypothetical protein